MNLKAGRGNVIVRIAQLRVGKAEDKYKEKDPLPLGKKNSNAVTQTILTDVASVLATGFELKSS